MHSCSTTAASHVSSCVVWVGGCAGGPRALAWRQLASPYTLQAPAALEQHIPLTACAQGRGHDLFRPRPMQAPVCFLSILHRGRGGIPLCGVVCCLLAPSRRRVLLHPPPLVPDGWSILGEVHMRLPPPSCLGGALLWAGRLVHQVDQAPEVNAAVVGERHLTGAAGGVTVLALLRQVEVLQGGAGELGKAHAPVSRHTAAGDAGGHHLVSTQPGQLGEALLDAHLLGGAGHVHRHALAHLAELQLVNQEVPDELDRLVEGEAQLGLADLALDLGEAG
mmetsp:Transcript_15128/g.32805  ORF Transcript_15128/g.32805 Transcript_15128/m.32805 type:complete len:278 (+) Transcript_15128:527-1360(+)